MIYMMFFSIYIIILCIYRCYSINPNCSHGKLNKVNNTCECDINWRHAGITDFFEMDKCTQYQCKSDSICSESLGINALCPVKGWNCYCGFSYMNYEKNNVKCMGFMYVLIIWLEIKIKEIMYYISIIFIILAIFSLPLGEKRRRCNHHDYSPLLMICNFIEGNNLCSGNCYMNNNNCIRNIISYFALSIYFLDIGIWFLILLSFIYLLILLAWITVWVIIIVVCLIIALVFLCIMSLCACDGGGCNIDCCNCECCFCECCDNNYCFYYGHYDIIIPSSSDVFDFNCIPDCKFKKILLFLFSIFPYKPENLEGGLFGCLFGGFTLEYFHNMDVYTERLQRYLYSNNYNRNNRHYNEQNNEPNNGIIKFINNKPTIEDFNNSNLFHAFYGKDYNQCTICYERIKTDKFNCEHTFCSTCSFNILKKFKRCPICRVPISEIIRYRTTIF